MAAIRLRVGEKEIRAVRSHPVRIVVPFVFSFLLLALDFFLLSPLVSLGAAGLAIFLAMAAFAAAVALWSWTRWRSTVFLITNQRVVDIDRVGIFRWAITDVNYANISDISFEISGLLETLLRAGDVLVSTQSGAHSIKAVFVSDPGALREAIMEQIVAAKIWSVPGHGGGGRAPAAGKDADGPEGQEDGLDPEDERAVARYADWRKKRRAMRAFFGDGDGPETGGE